MTNPSEAMIEKVARSLYEASGYEAERVAGPDCVVPGYDEDDEDAREFCRTLARAAFTAMQQAATPDDKCIECGSLGGTQGNSHGPGCSQAATPAAPACPAGFDPCICPDAVAAPVQDDDAEFLLDLALTMNDIEAAAIRRIAARLTPDRSVQDDDAELIEELTEFRDGCEGLMPEGEKLLTRAIARLTPDRVTPLVEALRKIAETPNAGWMIARAALRDGGFDA